VHLQVCDFIKCLNNTNSLSVYKVAALPNKYSLKCSVSAPGSKNQLWLPAQCQNANDHYWHFSVSFSWNTPFKSALIHTKCSRHSGSPHHMYIWVSNVSVLELLLCGYYSDHRPCCCCCRISLVAPLWSCTSVKGHWTNINKRGKKKK